MDILIYLGAFNSGKPEDHSGRFSHSTRIVPPSGIDWSAFMMILSITWLICPSSASTGQRSEGMENSHRDREPLRAKFAVSLTSSPIATVFLESSPFLENVRRFRVSS